MRKSIEEAMRFFGTVSVVVLVCGVLITMIVAVLGDIPTSYYEKRLLCEHHTSPWARRIGYAEGAWIIQEHPNRAGYYYKQRAGEICKTETRKVEEL